MSANRPTSGLTDSLLDVAGIRVGQVTIGVTESTPNGATGVTAVVAEQGAVGAVDVRGSNPGTRETDALSPLASGERIHAVILAGRSIFGLVAADGATLELERRGVGLQDGVATIPIVAAAVINDFRHGDPSIRPTVEDGRRAVRAALAHHLARPAAGNVGAGTGALTGSIVPPRLKGGTGHASLQYVIGDQPGLVVGALVVVNAAGSPLDADTGRFWLEAGGLDRPGLIPTFSRPLTEGLDRDVRPATTLGVIATNARLTKVELTKVAQLAHDGLARAIRPVHTPVDGDAVFAIGADGGDGYQIDPPRAEGVTIVGAMAADAIARAVLDAMRQAKPSGGYEAYVPPRP